MTNALRRRSLLAVVTSGVAGVSAGCLDRFDPAGSGDESGADPEDGPNGETSSESGADQDAAGSDEVLVTVTRDGEERDAVTRDQLEDVGAPAFEAQQGHYVPLELTDDGADDLVSAIDEVGTFDDSEPTETEVLLHTEEGETESHSLGANLAVAMEDGEYDGSLLALFGSETEATSFAESFDDER